MGGEFGTCFLNPKLISEKNSAGTFGILGGFRFAESIQIDFSGNLFLDGDMDVTFAGAPARYKLSGSTLGFGLRYVFAPISFGFGFMYTLFEEEIRGKINDQLIVATDHSDNSFYLVTGLNIPGEWIGFPVIDLFIDSKILGSNDIHKTSIQFTLGFLTFI